MIPIFVYGSLLHGLHNSHIIPKTCQRQPAKLWYADLYDYCGSFPMATPGNGQILGELVTIPPKHYKQVLSKLDTLEGYHGNGKSNFYNRTQMGVEVNGQMTMAWVYVGTKEQVSHCKQVISGNWRLYYVGSN